MSDLIDCLEVNLLVVLSSSREFAIGNIPEINAAIANTNNSIL